MRSLLLLLASAAVASAADPRADFFENKVRPLLVAKCFSCHSEEAKKSKGGLTLDTQAGLLAGGDSGPAVVPKKPGESKLIEAVGYKNDDLQMPPKEKLTDAEVGVLTTWVADGAAWPNATGGAKRKPGTITDEDRQWWAYRPVGEFQVPSSKFQVEDKKLNPIDGFVHRKLEQAKLTPAPEAEKRVLIRRLTYDLHGMPPTPTEIDEFVSDTSATAYEKLVDRLLASPRYGERQARFWLDLVRYADSDGFRIDDYRPTAWRYRDYVIDGFNADKPYSRFVKEQLAGDELYPDDPAARVATGYLRHGIYEYNNRDAKGHWANILNDITDTTADVFLGLGLQCARCHDHKFDPLLQKDYFRLQAFFAGLRPRDDVPAVGPKDVAEYETKFAAWETKTAKLRADIAALERPHRAKAAEGAITKFPDDIQAILRKSDGDRTPYEQQIHELAYRQVDYEYGRLDAGIKGADKEKLIALRKELAKFDDLKPPPLPTAPTCTDIGPTAPPITVPKKGDNPVSPGVPTVLDAADAKVTALPTSTGRRSALANWLTEPTNPLTARVFVNRLWQQHFGRGLAANASDFGKLGDPPTHPELLDWLAARFVADGWSVKKLHRLIVTSATYKQGATHPEPAAGKLTDPENKLLWKAPVRRLDAEQIRDAMLAATGELDLKASGPGSPASDPRRTIYTKIMRNTRDPLLDVFDAPYWFNSAASRDTTTTPVQSLFLFNGTGMLARGRAFAARLEADEKDEAKRVGRAYRLAFGRDATTEEVAGVLKFLDEQAKTVDPKKAVAPAATFSAGKLPYRDGQAALMNMTGGFETAGDKLPTGDFTVEAFVSPKSVADTAAVRTVVAHWDGNAKTGGWNFGVTGKQSRRKPQTVVLQLIGTKRDGTTGEEAVFSDHQLTMNKPYYLAAAVKLATKEAAGEVTFHLKDLSNDDEPLLTAKVPHNATGGFDNKLPLTLGRRSGTAPAGFDGLLDDVRLSSAALGLGDLLFTREGTSKHTVGYWQFEAKPGVMKDTAGGMELKMSATAAPPVTPRTARQTAWADFAHVLLNSSEFLYVE